MKASKIFGLLILVIGFSPLEGQNQSQGERQAEIKVETTEQGARFSAKTPPLGQIAGAPPAYYSYFWEFGDGQFSFEENPIHIYPHTGEFEVRLALTNNYDDGKPPPTRPKKVYVKKNLVASTGNSRPAHYSVVPGGKSLRIQTNHDPKPEEEIVSIFSYKNQELAINKGRLHLFFNEKKYKNSHFTFQDAREYHGESRMERAEELGFQKKDHNTELWASNDSEMLSISSRPSVWSQTTQTSILESTLQEARAVYKDQITWTYDRHKPGEERHLFTTLRTTKEMLADTNAIISMQGFYVPEGGSDFEVFTLEMQIVASHDPNHIGVSDTRVNFRRAKKNEISYKVRFQNTGEGPASEVRIETSIPEGLDKDSIELLNYYPYCPICPEEPVSYSCLDTLVSENKITFSFHNIYLPGIRQAGVFARDSTKGFIKFTIQPAKNIKRVVLSSQANIYFDKNPPIQTNTALTHFIGWAPGFKAGLDLQANDLSKVAYFVGLTISPVKASKWYYQGEIMLGYGTQKDQESTCFEADLTNPEVPGPGLFVLQQNIQQEQTLFLDIVPLQFRKNLLDFLSFGAGTQVRLILNRERETETIVHPEFFEDEQCLFPALPMNAPPPPFGGTRKLPQEGAVHLFGDLNAGLVKNGPVAGLRYLYSLNPNFSNRFQLYANWKF